MPDQHFHPGDRVLVSSPGGAVFSRKPGVVVTEEYADSQYDGNPSCCMVEIEGMTGPLSIPVKWLKKGGMPANSTNN